MAQEYGIVKAIRSPQEQNDSYRVEVLGVPFGSPQNRDRHGEFFSPRTEFFLDQFTPIVVYYHGFESPNEIPEIIGVVLSHKRTDEGLWFDILLDPSNPYARKVWEAAKQGKARASSGTIAHLSRIDSKTGEILSWPLVEISLFDLGNGREPANRYAVVLPKQMNKEYRCKGRVLKYQFHANLASRGKEEKYPMSTNNEQSNPQEEAKMRIVSALDELQGMSTEDGKLILKIDQVKRMIDEAYVVGEQLGQDTVKSQIPPEISNEDIDKAVSKMRSSRSGFWGEELLSRIESVIEQRVSEALNEKVQEYVSQYAYPIVSTYSDAPFYNGAYISLDRGVKTSVPENWTARSALLGILFGPVIDVRDRDRWYRMCLDTLVHREYKGHLEETRNYLSQYAKSTKAWNRITASRGLEWVAQEYSRELMTFTEVASSVYSRVNRIPITPTGPTLTYNIPMVDNMTQWYRIPEVSSTDFDSTQGYYRSQLIPSEGTSSTLSVKLQQLSSYVVVSEALTMATIFDIIQSVDTQLRSTLLFELNNIIINGDSRTDTNINWDYSPGSVPTKVLRMPYSLADGLRRVALGNSYRVLDASGLLRVPETFHDILGLMWDYVASAVAENALAFIAPSSLKIYVEKQIVNPNTTNWGLPIQPGNTPDIIQLPGLPPIIFAPEFHYYRGADINHSRLAKPDGTISTQAISDNTRYAILLVNFKNVFFAYTPVQVSVTLNPKIAAYEIIARTYIGLGIANHSGQSASAVAIARNVGTTRT